MTTMHMLETTGADIAYDVDGPRAARRSGRAAGAGDVGGSRRPDLIFGSPGTSTAYVLLSR